MNEDLTFNWNREDGKPWESVESLPPPLNQASRTSLPPQWENTTYDGPYFEGVHAEEPDIRSPTTPRQDNQPWESLKSFPPTLDERSTYEPPTVEDDEEWEDREETPSFHITRRAPFPPKIISSVPPLYDMGYLDPSRLPSPIFSTTRSGYPGYHHYLTTPGIRRGPVPLAIGAATRRGRRSSSPASHARTPGHPPVIPLSTLFKQLGISDPMYGPRRRHRPRSPLSPPPSKPMREEFVVEDVSYEVKEERLYANGREVEFSMSPRYPPPIIKKHNSSPRGKSRYGPRSIYGHGLRSAYAVPWDGQGRTTKGKNIWSVMNEMERNGQVVKKKSKHWGSRKSSKRGGRSAYGGMADGMGWERWNKAYGGRYYHAGGEKGKAGGHDDGEPVIVDGKDRTKVQFSDYDTAHTSGPEAGYRRDCDGVETLSDGVGHVDHDSGREIRRRRSVDDSEVDIYKSSHHHSDAARPFNIKRVHDKALEVLGPPKKSTENKGESPAFSVDPEDGAEGGDPHEIYGASEVEETKAKKVDPYEAFKKTTGRNPRDFYINRHGEAVERFVLDRRPLAHAGEESTGSDGRRPMIDVVNLKTGERTRKKMRGYDKLPTLIKVAAGVEMLNGRLPLMARKEVEEMDDVDDVEERDAGEESAAPKPRRKKGKGRRKKDKDCVVM